MRSLGWFTVGLFYFVLVWINFQSSAGSLPISLMESTTFFILSSFALSALILLACVVTWGNPVADNTPVKIKRLAVAGLGGLFIQIVLGSQVRQLNAGLACPNFPTCLDGFFPIPLTYETAIAFGHRWWGFLLLGHFFHLALAAARTSPSLARPTRRIFALSVAQVFLGVGTVMSGVNAHSRVLHAAVGYALWGLVSYSVIRSGGARFLWARFVTESKAPQLV